MGIQVFLFVKSVGWVNYDTCVCEIVHVSAEDGLEVGLNKFAGGD